jgi:virginiamycin A acetyltransferase
MVRLVIQRYQMFNLGNKLKRYISTLRSNICRLDLLHRKIKNSKILGSVSIGKNTLIRDSTLASGVIIGDNSKISSAIISGEVVVGRNTTISGPATGIYSLINPIKIGNFCSIARGVAIQEYDHQIDRLTSHFIFQNVFRESMVMDITSKGPILIGNDVWIGANCIILSGVKIGNGAVIAAGSVVTKDIPDFGVVAGVPAKVIKFRFDDNEIKKINSLRWWNWSEDKIRQNRELFIEKR